MPMLTNVTVSSHGKNFDGQETFLIVFPDGTRVECRETFRTVNHFARVQNARNMNNKIEAIKELRTVLKLGLKEAKDLMEALWR